MKETITKLAKKYKPRNGNWYVDVHGSEIEVGMDSTDCFTQFLHELDERNINYGVVDDGENSWVAYVYVYYFRGLLLFPALILPGGLK